MKISTLLLPLVLGVFTLLGSGCATAWEDDEQPSQRRSATLLTLVDESHQLTPEQMEERRRNIISYLIAEGYIYSGDELVQSAAFAEQIIRAKLALDGSFELTIYRPERISRREINFDPAGYPVYTYFPGDIGYFGDGFDPFYIPIAPYHGPRHYHRDRSRDRRDHGSPRPDGPQPPRQNPDWNRDHQPPRDGVNDGNNNRRRPDGDRPDGTRDPRNNWNRRPDRPNPPTTQPPENPDPNQPNPPRHGPRGNDRQPPSGQPPTPGLPPDQTRNPHQRPDHQPRPNFGPQPASPTTQPQPAAQPSQSQTQPDHRRFRPELQPQQPGNPSPRPSSPPARSPGENRTRPDGPPRSSPPPPRPAPEPAKETPTKSDSPPVQNETQTRSADQPKSEIPESVRRMNRTTR